MNGEENPPRRPDDTPAGTGRDTGADISTPQAAQTAAENPANVEGTNPVGRNNRRLTVLVYVLVVVCLLLAAVVLFLLQQRTAAPEQKVPELWADQSEMHLMAGYRALLPVTVVPAETPREVIYETSDAAVASVGENGVVTAVGPGRCTVTAKVGWDKVKIDVFVHDFNTLYRENCSSAWAHLGTDNRYLMTEWDDVSTDAYHGTRALLQTLGLPEALRIDIAHTTSESAPQTRYFTDIGLSIYWVMTASGKVRLVLTLL